MMTLWEPSSHFFICFTIFTSTNLPLSPYFLSRLFHISSASLPVGRTSLISESRKLFNTKTSVWFDVLLKFSFETKIFSYITFEHVKFYLLESKFLYLSSNPRRLQQLFAAKYFSPVDNLAMHSFHLQNPLILFLVPPCLIVCTALHTHLHIFHFNLAGLQFYQSSYHSMHYMFLVPFTNKEFV